MTQATNIPAKFLVPFAQNDAAKVEIPVTTTDPARASQSLGFPPLTMQPPEVGGVPPEGEDFNGAMNQVARVAWWTLLGGGFPYDSAFATAAQINGYPNGAALPRADRTGFWLNTADNNTTNPDATDGSAANWVPAWVYGSYNVSISLADVTLQPVNAAKQTLILSGTLTANRNLILPAWLYRWEIIDNTVRGGFTLTVKTAAGSGVALNTGAQIVRGDGTNIVQLPQSIAAATLPSQAATLAQISSSGNGAVQGAFKNLVVSTTGTSAPVTVTADEITVENSSNAYQTLRTVNVTPSLAASGANGLDIGTSAANTWYSVWVIWNGTTTAGLLSLSATTPTMPSGYTHRARVGWIRSDGTVNKYPLRLIQYGRRARYLPASGANVTALPTVASGAAGTFAGTPVAVAWANYAPSTTAMLALQLYTGAGVAAQVTTSTVSGTAGYQGFFSSTTSPGSIAQLAELPVESSNIYYASSGASSALYVAGWEDNL